MNFLFFLFGAFVGGIIAVAILCIMAVGANAYNKQEGDNQECTNQEQK